MSSRRRNAKFDFEVKIGYEEIEPQDLEQLRVTMNFSDAMIDAIHTLEKLLAAERLA